MKAKQENQQLRDYAKDRGVALWQIANAYGIHAMTLISRLRKPFSKSLSKEFMLIVDRIDGEKTGDET